MTVLKQYTVTADAVAYLSDTLRSRHSMSSAGAISAATGIAIFCPCNSAGDVVVNEMYVGLAVAGGNLLDMTSPVQVTWSGNTSILLAGVVGGVWSDILNLDILETDDIIISAYVSECTPPTLAVTDDVTIVGVETSGGNLALSSTYTGTTLTTYDGAFGFTTDALVNDVGEPVTIVGGFGINSVVSGVVGQSSTIIGALGLGSVLTGINGSSLVTSCALGVGTLVAGKSDSILSTTSKFGISTFLSGTSASAINLTAGMGLSATASFKNASALSVHSSFGLLAGIGFDYPGLATIAVGFGLGISIENKSSHMDIQTSFGFATSGIIDTSRIDSFDVGFGLGTTVIAHTTKAYSIISGFGLSGAFSLLSPQECKIQARFGLDSYLVAEEVNRIGIISGFGLSVPVTIVGSSDLQGVSIFGLHADTIISTFGTDCSIQTHNYTRWT